MNKYPLWKYILLSLILVVALIYSLPNLYGEDPAVQVSPAAATKVRAGAGLEVKNQITSLLKESATPYKSINLDSDTNKSVLIRFKDTTTQIKGKDLIKTKLGDDYNVALNLAPVTPEWLSFLGAKPMKLGLDLRGGVHFLMEVDVNTALKRRMDGLLNDISADLREQKLRYISARSLPTNNSIQIVFNDKVQADAAFKLIRKHQDSIELSRSEVLGDNPSYQINAKLSPLTEQDIRNSTVDQTIITLRNRINELGVAEAVAQRQGLNHVVIELPGIQDTARAKEILGKTATLEFLMEDDEHNVEEALTKPVPGSRVFYNSDNRPFLVKNRVILAGDSITGATVAADSKGMPAVSVLATGGGLAVFKKVTRDNVGKRMVIVFKETKVDHVLVEGKTVQKNRMTETVISWATINSPLGGNFEITGLKVAEAQDLALYLRAGALPATISIVEERTVGPSLGQENIRLGMMSIEMGMALVLFVMLVYYSVFGIIADLALCINVMLLIAILSLIGATLTLPGIAGIVLTVGMAVDANILIFERIREELRNGMSPQAAIHTGFEKAFSTILDSNVTTLIVGLVLFSIGSGPVRGFAITLCLGILTSMFTAVTVTRAMVNLVYGGYTGAQAGQRGTVQKLHLGM